MADEDSLNRKSRARQACEPCRKKKTKCSGEYPTCTNCSSHGFECSYITIEKRRGPQKGYVRALESRLDSLQNLLEDYVDKISPPANSNSRADSLMDGGEVFFEEEGGGNDRSTDESSPQMFSNEKQVVTNFVSRKKSISQHEISQAVTKKARSSDDHVTASNSPSLSMSHPKKVGHLTMVENGSYKYMGESSGAYLLQNNTAEDEHVYQSPLTNLVYSASYPALGPDFVIPKSQVDALIGLYFSTSFVLFPIFVKDEFLMEYNKPDSALPQTLIDAICACSCAYVSRSSIKNTISNPKQLGEAFYLRSRQTILSQVDQATPYNVQSLLLLSTCHHLNVGNLGWMSLGIALRMAMEMGLHRDYMPGRTDAKTRKEREERRRLWWGCYIMDRTASVTSGRPLTLDEEEYDTCFPEMEGEIKEIPYSTIFPKVPSPENTKKYMLKNIELWQIYGKVTRNIYSVRSRQGYSALKLQSHVQHLFETLQSWYTTLLRDWPQLKDAENSPEDECYQFFLTLKLNYFSLIILLYRPLLPRPGLAINSFAQAFYEKCKSAAIEITSMISAHSDAFIDLAAPFKFYPLLISFSIHLLGSSVSIVEAKLREASKQQLVDSLTVLSRFYLSSPLCGKILFGSLNVLISSNIIPAGYIDPHWPDSLKHVAKIFSDSMAKEESAMGNASQPAPSNKSSTPEPAAQQPRFMNPTQFLQAHVLGERSQALSPNDKGSSKAHSANVRSPEKNLPRNPPVAFDLSRGNLPNPHDHQLFQNQTSNLPPGVSFAQVQPPMAASREPISDQMMLYNNLLQSQNGSRMMPFSSGQMPMPAQITPFTFPVNQLFSGGQAFGLNVDDFMWDPLYNFDFSGFNNRM